MKRNRALSILLALALILSLLPAAVFAESESTQEVTAIDEVTQSIEDSTVRAASTYLPSGRTVTATNINSGQPTVYQTPYAGSSYTDFTYSIKIPQAGTLAITYAAADSYNGSASLTGYDTVTTSDGVKTYYIYKSAAASVPLKISLKGTSNFAAFSACFAPSTATITPKTTATEYILGRPYSSTKVTTFKMKVGAAGYLDFMAGDETSIKFGVNFKTAGFKDFEYLSASDARRYIGVKKGTYTFSVKSYSPMYGVKVKLVKVKQGKYGAKKKKAKLIKKKATRKGLVITNAKKAHWYKFKNPKLKKVKITIKGKVSNGGSYGGLKITMYDKKGSIGSRYFYPTTKSLTIQPYTFGKNNKLVKGTYYIKVESYKGGNGYFSVKWQ